MNARRLVPVLVLAGAMILPGCDDDDHPLDPIGDAGPATLSLAPTEIAAAVGESFTITVDAIDAVDLFALNLELRYDEDRLAVLAVTAADDGLLGDPDEVLLTHVAAGGTLDVGLGRPQSADVDDVGGTGPLLEIRLRRVAAGEATVELTDVTAVTENGLDVDPLPELGEATAFVR